MKEITVSGFFGAIHTIQVEDNDPRVTVDPASAPEKPKEDKGK